MKTLIISSIVGLGIYIGTYLGVMTSVNTFAKFVPSSDKGSFSASFDDVWPLTTGLQGEEHSLQLQPALYLQ